ncbi:MAG: glycine--tRNA ligase subunit beta [bacterium]
MASKKENMLLEIGCEEIPPSFIPPALTAMEKHFRQFAEQQRITHGEVKTYATPRRMALFVADVSTAQEPAAEEIKGPPASKALDPDGSFGKVAEKFAASRGGTLRDIEVRDTEKGKYLFLIKRTPGAKTIKLLPDFPPSLLPAIPFPKRMRWDDTGLQFARPIRWLLFLLGKTPVKVRVGGVVSGPYTQGHRFLSNKKMRVDLPENYLGILEKNFVMVDQEKRKEHIRRAIEESSSGVPVIPDELLDVVTFENEYPHAVEGGFNRQFLNIPPEVLMLCIEKTQKFFPVRSQSGRLMPKFVAVLNLPPDEEGTMVSALEKVLLSRLKDARFFYEEDSKIPLPHRVEDLKKVTFQKDLGTLFDKAERLHSLTRVLGEDMELPENKIQLAQRAAALCKADLTTSLVFEFPELQGIAGKYYATPRIQSEEECGDDDEDPRIPIAIEEHYMPRSADDALPRTDHGALLAIADRIDTLAGYFSAGLIPTGSEDPFSLRRQALGIIKILEDKKFPITLHRLIRRGTENYPEEIVPTEKHGEIFEKLLEFFYVRLRTYLIETHGRSYDAVNAVDISQPLEIGTILALTASLDSSRPKPDFQNLLLVFDRISNILRKSATGGDFTRDEPDPALFRLEDEKKLFRLHNEVRKAWEGIGEDGHTARIEALYRITPAAHSFFDNVMVMDEDLELRANRLALLKSLRSLYMEIADFSKMVKSS